jgi:hypothetical protein
MSTNIAVFENIADMATFCAHMTELGYRCRCAPDGEGAYQVSWR